MKRLLVEIPAGALPCRHLFQVWVEEREDTSSIHIHAECDDCERLGLEAVQTVYPDLPVIRKD